MNALQQLLSKGGPAILAIMALSVLLYWRCFALLLALRRTRRGLQARASSAQPDGVGPGWLVPSARGRAEEIRDAFQHQRIALGAMIAAAPLLGLLGTVSGMTKTFDTLARKAGEKSMEGLARGISEVLVATESGLLVALPALALVYLAHREVNACIKVLNAGESRAHGGPS